MVLTACATSIAGVAQPAPGANRSGAAPVPVTGSDTSDRGGTGQVSTAKPTDDQHDTDPETTGITDPEPTDSETTLQETTEQETTESRTTIAPTGATAEDATARLDGSGAIVVRRGTPKITVDVFEEPYCPPCAAFSLQHRTQLDEAVADGRIALRLRVVTFLDPKSPSRNYSTRVLSALLAVAGIDGEQPGVFLAFQNALFDPANQPKEGAAKDLTNAQIAALAEKAGVSPTAISAFGDDAMATIAGQVSQENQAALDKLGQDGVPTVAVKGKVVDHRKSDWLTRVLAG